MKRTEIHSHSCYSNLRMYDAISKVKDLINKAREIGLASIALTDHESLSGHVEVDHIQEEYKEKYPDFKIIRGNEIYLVDEKALTADEKVDYYHFILLALDSVGHRMLRELSTKAWGNSKTDRGVLRVPTLPSDVEKIVKKFGQGHIHASSACIAGRVAMDAWRIHEAKKADDFQKRKQYSDDVTQFIEWCLTTFGEDNFTLEVAPAAVERQIVVNNYVHEFSKHFGIPICIGTDSHYLTPEDRYAHQAFINARDERAQTIYQYAYLQTEEEIIENLKDTTLDYQELCQNSMKIYDKAQYYSLRHNQIVPQVSVPDFPKKKVDVPQAPVLSSLYNSDEIQERYWVNFCMEELDRRGLKTQEYIDELEVEADTMKTIGEKLDTCIFAYPIFLKKYIDLIWDCGSIVQCGRGSSVAGLNHWLLGIVGLNPMKYPMLKNLYFRFLNKGRAVLPDVDVDLAPSKRPLVFEKIREERGELGCVQVCTFGKITSRAAIKIACRGYRSEDYPEGIPLEEAEYISSLIPSERGFVWTIEDCLYGNEEKGRTPSNKFIAEIDSYPGLQEILLKISGIVNQRGIHASGVNFYDEDPFKTACFMKAKDGSWVTQYDLESAEYCGDVKYDFLVTEITDVMTQCFELLQEYGHIPPWFNLRQMYEQYINPEKIDLTDPTIWDKINEGKLLKLFQLDSNVGRQTAKQLKPRSLEELANVNSIMRLMPEKKGAETASQRYLRMKNNIQLWYDEVRSKGLTEEEIKLLEPHYLPVYGTINSQEQLMLLLLDKDICGLSLNEVDVVRKTIAKKKMDKIPEIRKLIISSAKSENLGQYIWETAATGQLGYAFSQIHSTSYSMIAIQCVLLATKFPEVYWNTACLRVDAGLEEDDNSNYAKIAKAVGNIKNNGVTVLPVDINKSEYFFTPEEKTNSIYFGMKGINGINNDVIDDIIKNRPYESLEDFLEKNQGIRITSMIALIKGGAFDSFGDRRNIMWDYLATKAKTIKSVTLVQVPALIDAEVIPDDLEFERRLYVFNKSLRSKCKKGSYYTLENNYYDFYTKFFDLNETELIDGVVCIDCKRWDKLYQKNISPLRNYIKNNQESLLKVINQSRVQEMWNKYALGSISKWEMDSMNYYYHEHELAHIQDIYCVSKFKNLPTTPVYSTQKYYSKKLGTEREYRKYNYTRIVGTIIGKNLAASTISLLTPESGVIEIRMNRERFAKYNKRIQEVGYDGKKFVAEKGWFDRGTLLMFTGYRNGDTFVISNSKSAKKVGHPICKIQEVKKDGTLVITDKRYDEQKENL